MVTALQINEFCRSLQELQLACVYVWGCVCLNLEAYCSLTASDMCAQSSVGFVRDGCQKPHEKACVCACMTVGCEGVIVCVCVCARGRERCVSLRLQGELQPFA